MSLEGVTKDIEDERQPMIRLSKMGGGKYGRLRAKFSSCKNTVFLRA